MRHRPVLATLALSLLLVTAGCTAALGSSPGATASPAGSTNDPAPAEAEPGRTIAVGATGQVQAQPNQAVLRVAVEATGENASAVRQRLAENVSRMREALSEMGIGSDQVTTTDFDIRSQRRYGGERRERPAFRGRHAFTITLTDLDRTGTVIVTAVEHGVTSVEDVRFSLTEERRSTLRRQALAEAMESARGQAGVIADGANLTVTGVGTVRTADVGYRPVRMEAATLAGDAGGAPTTIEGGAVTVTAQVQVTYNATADA